MVPKRGLIPEENPESQENHQRNQRVKSILSTWYLLRGEWVQENSAQIEESLRNVVRPVVESIILHHPSISRSLPNEAELSKLRKFKLQFEGQLPCKLYTGNNIEAEGSLPLKIVLLDALSGQVVMDGPLSSAKVEIVVLHGHFKVETLEGWTQKEFNDSIVLARDKSSLLFGECVIALCNGIGFVKGIRFTDNSSWVRSKMFRLGAKVKPKTAKENEVREAVSSAFRVKHGRGTTYEKHSAPSLEHEVWHLQGISKDGKIHNRLKDHQIYKVEHLLQQYHKDQSSLRHLIRSSKTWKAIQQLAAFFRSDVCTVQRNCGPSLIPTDPFLGSTVPLSAAAVSQDQQEFQMPCIPRIETSHGVDGYMDLNPGAVMDNVLMEEWLATPCDDGQHWPSDCNLPLSPPIGALHEQATFHFPTPNLFSDVHQSTVDAGNGSFLGATRITPMGTFSPVLSLGASTSQRANPKRRFWSKIRAVCRMVLIRCGAATRKKEKFPLIS